MGDALAVRSEIDAAIEGKTLCGLFAATASAYPDREALKIQSSTGEWETFTWAEYRERVRAIALGLRALGLEPGDFGVILSRNRPEYAMADLGIMHAGGTPVGLYNTLAPGQVAYIAGHCEARFAVVEDVTFLERVLSVREQLPRLDHIVVIDPAVSGVPGVGEGVVSLDEVIATGREAYQRDPLAFDAMWQAVKPDDLCTLIYTSGTTGPPKGVMKTHRNVLWSIESLARVMPMSVDDRVISYLPFAHVADRFLTLWQGLASGFSTHYCPDISRIAAVMLEVHPTFFGAVPRVWEKLYAGINAGLSRETDDARRSMIASAIDAGRAASSSRQRGEVVAADLAETVAKCEPVFAAIRGKIGLDQCRVVITGAAPTPYEVLEFFDAIGIGIAEVWGMSELSAVVTMNPLEAIRLGTIGTALPGVECRIAEDGELLVSAGLTMPGYYKEPEKSAETLAGGWMHTGDVATIDDDGYIRIVDRKKELIITAGGKNISPANLEGLLKEHPLIGQACVIGDNRPYLSALIVLDGEVAPAWAGARGIEAFGIAELARSSDVSAEIERAVSRVNVSVSRVESIRRWTVLPVEWTADSDELTPTLKLKRRVINEKYAKEIESLYS